MIFEKAKEIIKEQFNVDENTLSPETSFTDDLNADSLDLVELVMALEDEYGIEIEDDSIETIKTIGDAVNYIKHTLGEDN